MEKYLMMMYVTLEQETAVKHLFLTRGWTYIKQDLTKMTRDVGPVTAVSNKKGPQYSKPNDASYEPSPPPPKKRGRPSAFKTSLYTDVDTSYGAYPYSTSDPTYPFTLTTNTTTKLKSLAPKPAAPLSPTAVKTGQETPFVKLTNICQSKQYDLSKPHVYVGGSSVPANQSRTTANSTVVAKPKTTLAKPANKNLMVKLAGITKSKEFGLSKTNSIPQFKKRGRPGRPKKIPTQGMPTSASAGHMVSLAPPDMPTTAAGSMATSLASSVLSSQYTPPRRGRPPKKLTALSPRPVKVEPVSPQRGRPAMSKPDAPQSLVDIGLAVGMSTATTVSASSTPSSPHIVHVPIPVIKKGRPAKTPEPKGPPKKRGRPPKFPNAGPLIPKVDGRTKAAKLAMKGLPPTFSVPKIDGRSKAAKLAKKGFAPTFSTSIPKIDGRSKAAKLAKKAAGPNIPKVDGRTKLAKWAKKAAMLKAMSSSGNTLSSSWTTVMSPSSGGGGGLGSTVGAGAANSLSSPSIQITSVQTLSGMVPSSSSVADSVNQLPWRSSTQPVVVKQEPIEMDDVAMYRVERFATESVQGMTGNAMDATVISPTSTPPEVPDGTSYFVTQNSDTGDGEIPVVNGVCHEPGTVAEVDNEDIAEVDNDDIAEVDNDDIAEVDNDDIAEVGNEDIVGVGNSMDVEEGEGPSCNQMSVSVDAMFTGAGPVVE